MPLRQFLKNSAARLRSNASRAKTPSPDSTSDAHVETTTTTTIGSLPSTMSPPATSIAPLPTTMSPPIISTASTTNPPSLSTTTPTRAPILTPTPFDPMTSPLSSPVSRALHRNTDQQRALSRAHQSREREVDKTRDLIAEMMRPGRLVEHDQQTMEKWLALQERWINWLEKDMEKVRVQFYALEAAEIVLRGGVPVTVGRAAELGEVGVVLAQEVGAQVEALPGMMGELGLGGEGEGGQAADGGSDARELNGGGDGADGMDEGHGVNEGVDGSGS
ncbi:hypothetical protein MMC11_001293 [Xylographa trunciseda]|nr:hypothetical protein [Xylographa trunciseda]